MVFNPNFQQKQWCLRCTLPLFDPRGWRTRFGREHYLHLNDVKGSFMMDHLITFRGMGFGRCRLFITYTIYTIYLSLCTQTAETTSPEPFSWIPLYIYYNELSCISQNLKNFLSFKTEDFETSVFFFTKVENLNISAIYITIIVGKKKWRNSLN